MRVLVTGASGFVMSVFIRALLETDARAQVDAADLSTPDALWWRHLDDVRDRVRTHRVDVREAAAVRALTSSSAPDVVVHGATVTHAPDLERADPTRFVDVNVMGTAHVLDAARQVDSVGRCILISSGAVYGAGTPDGRDPQPESTSTRPDETYGITKLVGELIAARFTDLYGLPVPILRFSKVFGPMERPTGARTAMSVPFHLAGATVAGRAVRITTRSCDASGDWISACDVAAGLVALCRTGAPPSGPISLAAGRRIPVPELLRAFGTEVVWADSGAQLDLDPALRNGKDGSYAVHRARSELGWAPRPLEDQVSEYLAWARRSPEVFAASERPAGVPQT
ncbi:NAD-dependent epimerase/dehydratase family protein [Pseudonocardia kunmingensis]|uniref:dTDP-glucose 4,6-dehydratase/UDP-glucose 4-epimerase n=1 Tax=Pseudonocardia kunmingensis TaxID=630975 RepID=A0A543DQV3_9PSEU|nr:NAD(P)-dependent oxidoreductase [Pseudonocardia kunmingensis]TQM11694.1 dTDP-glucose 4,6-dehydratase/UDP-glucose 4-epimerase [Pseudonocardia kunmingensis]